jgi:hypothetical protein
MQLVDPAIPSYQAAPLKSQFRALDEELLATVQYSNSICHDCPPVVMRGIGDFHFC